MILLSVLAFLPYISARAPSGSWDDFNYAPETRNVAPATILLSSGDVTGIPSDSAYTETTNLTFSAKNSSVVFDFTKEVISFTVTDASADSSIGLAFTESSEFINPEFSDNSCAVSPNLIESLQLLDVPIPSGVVAQSIGQQRGGFRYMTMVSTSNASVTVSNITLELTFMPQWDDLTAYTGYFSTSDPVFDDPDFLTKLWYAGAILSMSIKRGVKFVAEVSCLNK